MTERRENTLRMTIAGQTRKLLDAGWARDEVRGALHDEVRVLEEQHEQLLRDLETADQVRQGEGGAPCDEVDGPVARTALAVQVGGNHYKSLPIQPVELALANRLEGCEMAVIKYVTRWREKDGLKDLRKARHFLQFLEEHFDDEARRPAGGGWGIDPLRYCVANRLGYCESRVVLLVHTWAAIRRREQVVLAMQEIDSLIAVEFPAAPTAEEPA